MCSSVDKERSLHSASMWPEDWALETLLNSVVMHIIAWLCTNMWT